MLLALGGLGCGASVHAFSDWERGVDLRPTKTFSVARSPLLPRDLTPEQARLVDVVEATTRQELIRKGYREAPRAEAQLLATSHFTERDRIGTKTQDCENYWQDVMYEGALLPGGAVAPCQETVLTTFEEGTLLIDVYDTQRKELVWHGWASAPEPEPGAANTPALLQQATLTILARFPP